MSLVRNTLVQSTLTLASRILGFIRDILLAARIGAGPVGDAFVTALMFPNLFRRVFAEGAFAQAFVPLYARTLEAEGEEAARKVAGEALRALLGLTAGLVIAAQLTMPWIMLVFNGGYADQPVPFRLSILLTQITMPYLACMAMAALMSGVLNSAGKFALSAGAPTVLNICLIGAAFLGDDPASTARFAAIAVTLAGLLQAGLLWWGVRRLGIRLSLGIPRITPNVRRVFALAVPGTIAASATQINIIVSQALSSFETSAKTWLYYADRLYQLPLGLVGVAIGIAILPRLARAARSEDHGTSTKMMDDGVGLAMALSLPAAAALIIAPAYLIEGLFARGAFSLEDAGQAGRALMHYGWGVPAFVLIKVLAPAYFAREDMKTPMRFALLSVVINTVLGAGLFFWLRSQGGSGFVGLAFATSVAAWANAFLLFLGLRSRGWYRPGSVLVSRLIRVLLASAAMAAVLFVLLAQREVLLEFALERRVLATGLFILTGMVTYSAAALVVGAVRLSDIKGLARRSSSD